MADMMQTGAAWHAAMLKNYASQAVTIQRGSGSTMVQVQLLATFGKTDYEQDDGSGAFIQAQARDFMFDAADFTANSVSLMPPQRNDRIFFNGQVFEVTNLGRNPCWKWADAYRGRVRVHTKQISE